LSELQHADDGISESGPAAFSRPPSIGGIGRADSFSELPHCALIHPPAPFGAAPDTASLPQLAKHHSKHAGYEPYSRTRTSPLALMRHGQKAITKEAVHDSFGAETKARKNYSSYIS